MPIACRGADLPIDTLTFFQLGGIRAPDGVIYSLGFFGLNTACPVSGSIQREVEGFHSNPGLGGGPGG